MPSLHALATRRSLSSTCSGQLGPCLAEMSLRWSAPHTSPWEVLLPQQICHWVQAVLNLLGKAACVARSMSLPLQRSAPVLVRPLTQPSPSHAPAIKRSLSSSCPLAARAAHRSLVAAPGGGSVLRSTRVREAGSTCIARVLASVRTCSRAGGSSGGVVGEAGTRRQGQQQEWEQRDAGRIGAWSQGKISHLGAVVGQEHSGQRTP